MIVGFLQPGLTLQCSALFNYAYYNEMLLGNDSVIFYQKDHREQHDGMVAKMKAHFQCVAYDSFSEITNLITLHRITVMYGLNAPISPEWKCHIINHSIQSTTTTTTTSTPNQQLPPTPPSQIETPDPNPIVPLIVAPASWRKSGSLRAACGIAEDAIVMGRYGGFYDFNIGYVKETIRDILQTHPHVWFLFLNTQQFIRHERALFFEGTPDTERKRHFIAACDAMLHARSLGEVFGMSCGEFSAAGKPILTACTHYLANHHISVLGSRALLYHNASTLTHLILNIRSIHKLRPDWNAYHQYEPHRVMSAFQRTFLMPDLLTNNIFEEQIFKLSLTPRRMILTYLATDPNHDHLVPFIRALVETVADRLENMGWPFEIQYEEEENKNQNELNHHRDKNDVYVYFGNWSHFSKPMDSAYVLFNIQANINDNEIKDESFVREATGIWDYREENIKYWETKYGIKNVLVWDLCLAYSPHVLLPQRKDKAEKAEETKTEREEDVGMIIVTDYNDVSALEVVQIAKAISSGHIRVVCGKTFLTAFPQFKPFVATSDTVFTNANYAKVKEAAGSIPIELVQHFAKLYLEKKSRMDPERRRSVLRWLNDLSNR